VGPTCSLTLESQRAKDPNISNESKLWSKYQLWFMIRPRVRVEGGWHWACLSLSPFVTWNFS
jgi:hypothetical protein